MRYVNLNRKTYGNAFSVKIRKKTPPFRENWQIFGKWISATAQQNEFNLKITMEKNVHAVIYIGT
jgi:hypothetical protein